VGLTAATLSVAGFLAGTLPALAALPAEIKVDLFQAYPAPAQIVLQGPLTVLGGTSCQLGAGKYLVRLSGGLLRIEPGAPVAQLGDSDTRPGFSATQRDSSGAQPLAAAPGVLVVRGLAPGGLGIYCSGLHRSYRGTITISTGSNGRLHLSNRVSVRDYVTAVVGSETLAGFPGSALQAQAVLTQTRLTRWHADKPLPDTTSAEAYLGTQHERPEVKQAVTAVWGNILAFRHSPILSYYHSTCAGGTSNGEKLFGLDSGCAPYLSARPCRFCRGSPFWRPTVRTVASAALLGATGASHPVIGSLDAAGRPQAVMLDGKRTLSGYEFWLAIGRACGWDKVPGTRYSFTSLADGRVTFSSTGAGHGVGLCQWGARELACRGKSCRQILEYYFPGTHIEKVK
jgi:stage II sporulation protein D